jgi:hypothetical protein
LLLTSIYLLESNSFFSFGNPDNILHSFIFFKFLDLFQQSQILLLRSFSVFFFDQKLDHFLSSFILLPSSSSFPLPPPFPDLIWPWSKILVKSIIFHYL